MEAIDRSLDPVEQGDHAPAADAPAADAPAADAPAADIARGSSPTPEPGDDTSSLLLQGDHSPPG